MVLNFLHASKKALNQHPFFNEPKENVTTSIPASLKRFVEKQNLKYNLILIEGIKEYQGEGGIHETKQDLKQKLFKMGERFERLVRVIERRIGDKATTKLIEEAESLGRMVEKANEKK